MKSRRTALPFAQPTFHFRRFLFLFSALYFSINIGLLLIFGRLYDMLDSSLQLTPLEVDIQDLIRGMFSDIAIFGFLGFSIAGLFTFFYAFYLSHRFAGPVRGLMILIEKLNQGHYDFRRELRDSDELSELGTALNGLAQTLETRHGKGGENKLN